MKYYSLISGKSQTETHKSFREAVIEGLAPDRGLYFPMEIPRLPKRFFEDITRYSHTEIATAAISPLIGDDIPEPVLKDLIDDTLQFDFPLIPLEKDVFSLELFHGPTLAFKDVGARFMARCLGYFNRGQLTKKVTVLVATSGDTGGAVANGFYKVPGVEVVILYPSGKVSDIQEKQLTTLGENITAIEVDGTFDDCQDMVKKAFLDKDLKSEGLTSANSINVARWLPQLFYYLFTYRKLQMYQKPLVFAVPSGNFGNIAAGIVASRLGMPVSHFIAATNVNDTVPRFLRSGRYEPKKSVATISNAMDVGNPSNFVRIQELLKDHEGGVQAMLSGYSFTDEETREAMRFLYREKGYLADPHGAVGYLGLRHWLDEHPGHLGVFLETAHPIKFLPEVEKTLNVTPKMPTSVEEIIHKSKKSIPLATYEEVKTWLLSR